MRENFEFNEIDWNLLPGEYRQYHVSNVKQNVIFMEKPDQEIFFLIKYPVFDKAS